MVRAGLVALVLAASTGLLASAPAGAAPITCADGSLCLWNKPTEPDNSGPPADAKSVDAKGVPAKDTCLPLTFTWSDGSRSRAQYFWSKLDYVTLAFFSGDDCSGEITDTASRGGYGNTGEARSVLLKPLPADCEAGKICFWENDNFTGEKLTVEWANFCQNNGNFIARSFTNKSPYTITLYEGSYCVGANSIIDVPSGAFIGLKGGKTIGRWKLA